MEANDRKIRFGVLVNGEIMERWQRECINLLIDNGIELASVNDGIDAGTLCDVDFILSFKYGEVDDTIRRSARYGVWEIYHHDERVVTGGPPGFWEYMRKIPTNGIILRQLSDNPRQYLILKRIQLDTILHSYKAHRERLLKESITLPLQVCKDLIVNGKLKPELSTELAQESPTPNLLHWPKFVWLYFWRRIVFHFNYYFRQEDWNVGYCMTSVEAFAKKHDNTTIHWLKPPKSEYFADPFVITTKDDTYLFFEWFSNKKGKGDIAMAKKSENFGVYHKISDFPEHRSYPFIFEYQDVIYCIPEANQTNKVSLYHIVETHGSASLQWDCDMLEGKFVDSTLFIHNDKFYLFTTPQNQPHTHLLIFVADELRGPYHPHYNNPVKVDCSDARMAGKIMKIDGELIRPAQNSTHHYGESITLNKIVKLNEYQYIEEEIKEIKPDKKWTYNKGIHTINSDGDMTVFDAKRFTFTMTGFWQQLRQKFF